MIPIFGFGVIPLPFILGGGNQQNRQINTTTSRSQIQAANDTAVATPTEQEWRCFCLVNQQRQRYGLQPHLFSPHLLALARQHSHAQYQAQSMHHSTLPYGENVAKALGTYDPVMTALSCWMNSPPHFQNIVSPHARYSAVGIYVGNDNSHLPINQHDHWFTQLFQS